jgi:glycosyltransferase involved in cell wall biosynthesis
MNKELCILGTRGVPASHGGFETFAERLSLYLTNKGWNITVYCQENGTGKIYESYWNDIKLIHIPVNSSGALSTILFDWKSTLHASRTNALILTLGYNTAIFSILYRLKKNINIINMDGIEWKREKWSVLERTWLFLNERIGCYVGNHLIADHPEIKNHLCKYVHSDKVATIPYGSDNIQNSDNTVLDRYSLKPFEYAIVIARPEPENSILEIVSAFSRKKRQKKLVILGNYDKCNPEYKNKILASASDEILFLGAIYDQDIVNSLRYNALIYIHGHQVGGTNPSLVEALGAKNPVLAHNNKFNRWVAGESNRYFSTISECDSILSEILDDREKLNSMSESSKSIHYEHFMWDTILMSYENLLTEYL